MDTQNAPPAQSLSDSSLEQSPGPLEKIKHLTSIQKFLIFGGVVFLIILAAILLMYKQPIKNLDQPTLPAEVIVRVGDSNVYQGYLDKELKLYPATKSAEVKEQLKQKVIDDQITLVEAKKAGIIKEFSDNPTPTDQEYLQRARIIMDVKLKIEEARDSLIGSLVSLGFYHSGDNAQTLAKNKELAFSKINPVYEKLKNKQITLDQARQTLSSDSAVRRLDSAISANVAASFNIRKGNKITYWPEFDTMLWQTNVGDVTPLYIGRTQDKSGNIVEATYVFGVIDKKTEDAGYSSYKQWLDQRRKQYNLSVYGIEKSNFFASLLPSIEVFALDSDQTVDNGSFSGDNGGNAGDGNLSNQPGPTETTPNSCDQIVNSGASCDNGSSGPPPPPPLLSPSWAGTVFTGTGATLPGANVAISCSTGSGGATSDATGAYSSPPIAGVNYTCNPINLSATYGGILCQEYQKNIPNTTETQYNNFICNLGPPACGKPCPGNGYCEGASDGCNFCRPNSSGVNVCQPPLACGAGCQKDAECIGNKEGCTACLPGDSGGNVCRPPAACGVSCAKDSQCAGSKDGCTVCLPNDSGTGNVCRPPAACGVSCAKDSQCAGSKDGCTVCLPNDSGTGNVCRPAGACNVACTKDAQCAGAKDGCNICSGGTCKAPACGVSCSKDSQCAGAKDGCTSCLPSDTGSGNVCRPTPACGVSCAKDSQCAGAKDGCTACVNGACKIPPACGIACTTKADCSGAKDSCDQCLEGTCTDFSDNMCKCDGITADLSYPSNAFKFEAFGKVEGTDTKKAAIADITFRLTKDNQVIAKSNPITPEIIENSDTKMRFKAAWQTPPPPVSKDSTYRVFADVRCKPKRIVADASQTFSPAPQPPATLDSYPPKGLALVLKGINGLFGGENEYVKSVTDKLLSMFSTSTVRAQDQLQLQTLKFVKLLDTDNCRFVMFKFDESLF